MTTKTLIAKLTSLGLVEADAILYLNCLKSGPIHPSEAARLTGLKRPTLYLGIERLTALGLLHTRLVRKRRMLYAESPDTLQKLQQEREKAVAAERRVAAELAKALKQFSSADRKGEWTEFSRGKGAVARVLQSILDSEEDFYWLGSFKTLLGIIGDSELYRKFTWKRLEKNTTAWAITDDYIRTMPRYAGLQGRFRQTRILTGGLPFCGMFAVCGSRIAFVTAADAEITESDISVMIYNSPLSAELLRHLFLALWRFLPKV